MLAYMWKNVISEVRTASRRKSMHVRIAIWFPLTGQAQFTIFRVPTFMLCISQRYSVVTSFSVHHLSGPNIYALHLPMILRSTIVFCHSFFFNLHHSLRRRNATSFFLRQHSAYQILLKPCQNLILGSQKQLEIGQNQPACQKQLEACQKIHHASQCSKDFVKP